MVVGIFFAGVGVSIGNAIGVGVQRCHKYVLALFLND